MEALKRKHAFYMKFCQPELTVWKKGEKTRRARKPRLKKYFTQKAKKVLTFAYYSDIIVGQV